LDGNKNFTSYREQLHSINSPCIPFLGLYLTDLIFIEDGNPNCLNNNDKMINFNKQSATANIIHEIQKYQKQVYCLQPVPELQIILKESLKISVYDINDDDMYQMSLTLEPDESEYHQENIYAFPYGFI